MPNIFFTSDEHYYHNNILKYCGRPFANVDDMNDKIVEEHNAIVGKNDIVYHLGDFTFRSPFTAANIIRKLNGNHAFIAGNHDEWLHHKDCETALQATGKSIETHTYLELRGSHNNEKYHIVLFHFPLLTWHKGHKGSTHLHGHTHANLDEKNRKDGVRRFDMGIDSAARRFGQYRPFRLTEVLEMAANLPANVIDFGGE